MPFLPNPFLADAGTIEVTTSVATMTGAIDWYLSYVPLDTGATVLMTAALWACLGCGCRYTAGAPRCPECPSSDHEEEGAVPSIHVSSDPHNEWETPPDPTPSAPAEGGASSPGTQLLDIREYARQEFDFYAERPPMACPRDGEPLAMPPRPTPAARPSSTARSASSSIPRLDPPPAPLRAGDGQADAPVRDTTE